MCEHNGSLCQIPAWVAGRGILSGLVSRLHACQITSVLSNSVRPYRL